MNINLIKLKGVIRELHGIRLALERMADAWETELMDVGLKPTKVDPSGPEPTIGYTEEDMDWAREEIDFLKRMEDAKDKELE